MQKPMEIVLGGHRLAVIARSEEQAKFWRALAPGAAGGWEDDTLRFVEARARPGITFLDVGAWIGPLSLLAARRGARALALEPDPVARAALEDHLARNGLHATVLPAALHADGDGLTLYGGSRGLGGSRTSALGFHRGSPVQVPTVTPEEVADRAGPGPVLMKVDIEGHEYAPGPGARPPARPA